MNISVVIPAYNSEDTLKIVLKAILKELVENDQVIVADDRSSDSTAEIAGETDCVDYVLSNRSSGAAGTRNAGAALARNQWIVFMDSDAVPPEGWRKILEEKMQADCQGIQGVYGKNSPGTGAATYYKNYYYHYTFTKRIRSQFINGCATYFFAVRSSVFKELHGFNENFSGASVEDAEFASRLVRSGGRILLVPELEIYHLKQYSFREFIQYEWMIMTAKARLLMNKDGGGRKGHSVSMAKPAEMIHVLISGVLVWLIPAGLLCWILGNSVGLAAAAAGFLFVASSHCSFWASMVKDGGVRGLKASALTFPDLMLMIPAVLFSAARVILKPS